LIFIFYFGSDFSKRGGDAPRHAAMSATQEDEKALERGERRS
jgi:hypothetical protein